MTTPLAEYVPGQWTPPSGLPQRTHIRGRRRIPEDPREKTAFRLMACGYGDTDIADHLGMDKNEATRLLNRMTSRLRAVNRHHAVAKALKTGYLKPEDIDD